jgi:6-phosphogluconolactonase
MENIRIFKTATKINKFLTSYLIEIINNSIKNTGQCTITLSGGNTPLRLYEKLSKVKNLNWNKIHFFMADERFVEIGDKNNNYSSIKSILFDKINIPEKNIHFIDTNLKTAGESADKYNEELQEFFKTSELKSYPDFDIIILGIGTDGHTASLFPNSESLNESVKFAVNSKPEQIPFERITLTIPVLNNSKNVFFIVTGDGKNTILKRILSEKENLPASKIHPVKGNLLFILDKAAAEGIHV